MFATNPPPSSRPVVGFSLRLAAVGGVAIAGLGGYRRRRMAEPGTIAAPRWRDGLIAVALAAAVLVVYRHAFAVYFLNEDFTWLRQCRFRSGRGLWQLLTQDVMGGTYSWRPLMQVSMAVSYAISGLDPFGYRLDSLVWHIGAVWLVYAIGRMVADRQRAVTAAVVFGLHPLQG